MSTRNVLLTAAGFVLLGIGAVGVVIPVMPTTPFVITAAACFAGNPRMHAWLMKNRFFAEHITNYRQRTGLKKSTIALSLSFLWGMLLVSALVVAKPWVALLLAAVGICVTVHIMLIARPRNKK